MEDPLAERILMGDFKAGDTIYVDAQNGETVFTNEKPEAVPVAGEPTPEPTPEVADRLDKLMGE